MSRLDDPVVVVPEGYSVVDLDAEPFTFDRAGNQVIDLIEPEGSADDAELGEAGAGAQAEAGPDAASDSEPKP